MATDTVFEGLTCLRPCRIAELLDDCIKFRMKRLFSVFADRHDHTRLRQLERSIMDLESGD